MTEKQLRRGLDAGLSGAELSEQARLRVLAQVKGEEPIMKKKMSLAFVMTMALLILTATAALAVGITQGSVNWRGEPKTDEIMARPTPEPENPVTDMQLIDEDALDRLMGDLAAELEPDEMLIGARRQNGEEQYAARQNGGLLASFDELDDRLGLLPRPKWIPEGYELKALSASYSAAEYELTDESGYPGGIVVSRYRGIEPFLSGFYALYENAAGERLTYSATLNENSDEMGFGVQDGDAVERLEIANMDDALLFVRSGANDNLGWERTNLYMRRALDEPVPYRSSFSLFGEDYWQPEWDKPYAEVQVKIMATAMSGDDLVKVQTGKGTEDVKTE